MYIDKHGYKHIEIGDKFNKLTVIEDLGQIKQLNGQKKRMLKCKCECNNIVNIFGYNLINGHTKSCGHCNDINIGDKFGKLTVIKKVDPYIRPNGKTESRYECNCDCGNKGIIVIGYDLKSGHTKSCGCIQKEITKQNFIKHGLSDTRIYHEYGSMKQRCYNPNSDDYYKYGGRGIIICNEWLDKNNGFMNFYNWSISHGYRDDLEIDRINVNGNYEPSNCRWIPKEYQAHNKRTSIKINFNGEEYNIKQIANILGVGYNLLKKRLKKNNYNLSSLFTQIIDCYGNTWNCLLDQKGNPIPIYAIYFIDEYGFPINMNDQNTINRIDNFLNSGYNDEE